MGVTVFKNLRRFVSRLVPMQRYPLLQIQVRMPLPPNPWPATLLLTEVSG